MPIPIQFSRGQLFKSINFYEALIPAELHSRAVPFSDFLPTVYGASVVRTPTDDLEFEILQEYVKGPDLEAYLNRMLKKYSVIGAL